MTALDHAPVDPPAPPRRDPLTTGHSPGARDPAGTANPTSVTGASVTGELHHVDARAAARVVGLLAAIVAAAWVLGVMLLWLTADALGATSHLERLVRDLGFEGFRLASAPFFLGIGLLGVVFVLACTVATLLAATAFNAVVHVTGGVPVTVVTAPHTGD